MIVFARTDELAYIAYDRRHPGLESAQKWCPWPLQKAALLVSGGPGSQREIQSAFRGFALEGNWFQRTKSIDALIDWVASNPTAGVRDLRKHLKELAADDPKLFPDGKRAKVTAAMLADDIEQRMVCSVPARNDKNVCPGCDGQITQGEYINEAQDELWHSMCAPHDDIVVGELLDREGEFIQPITLGEEPGATGYIVRTT